MLAGIKIRIYPNATQRGKLWQMFGNDRYLWNQMLDMMQKRYKNNPKAPYLNHYALGYILTQFKKEKQFLKNSDSTSLKIVLENIDNSYKKMFNKAGGHPKFHGRNFPRQSFTGYSTTTQVCATRYMHLPKLGYMKCNKLNRLKKLSKKIKRYTLTYDACGRYYLTITAEIHEKKHFKKTWHNVGIDVGVADLAILSNGFKYKTFDSSYFENKAKEWQSHYSVRRDRAKRLVAQDRNKHALIQRSLENFANVEKARIRKARYQKKVSNQRTDYLQKVTTEIVKNYDVIAIEDLKAKNLQKNHHLAHSIANASWYEFRRMLTYKCEWYGKKLIAINPRNTSRICSKCGFNSGAKPLNIREWTCPKCHAHHDRDINAAINILDFATKPNSRVPAMVNS